jgi:hypothetical protein
MKSCDGTSVPPHTHCPQSLGNKSWRYANCVCDFYLRVSIEFHLEDPLISPITTGEEGLPVQSGPDNIHNWPATSAIAEKAIEVLGIFADLSQADVGANPFSRRACFRHRVETCCTSKPSAGQHAMAAVPCQIADTGSTPSTTSGLVRRP